MKGDLNQTFGIDPGIVYLNHAAVSPWPLCATDAVIRFAQENAYTGAEHYPAWIKKETQLRKQLQTLINAPSSADIALLKNTSEALSIVAHGLLWQAGDNVVISDEEFPSNRIVWESLKSQGVEVRQVALRPTSDKTISPEEALINATNDKTRLLSISSVQYASGLAVNLQVLGEHCKHKNILFCVDAIQTLGAVPIDVQAIHADFLMADGHKWMLGPEGLALFYSKAEQRERLKLHQYGWHMLENPNDFEKKEWSIAKSARRFECGSPNMLGIHALSASVELILNIGLEKIGKQVCCNSRYLMEKLSELDDISLITPTEEGRFAGIVTFNVSNKSHLKLFEHYREQRLICALRGDGIRFSPHFYTGKDILDKALDIVVESIKT